MVDPSGHDPCDNGGRCYGESSGTRSTSNSRSFPIIGIQKPNWWPRFIPYTRSFPSSFKKEAIVSWISANNIPTTISAQAGLDAGIGYWIGVASGGEVQGSFNWWSGELAYTLNASSAVRNGPPGGSIGAHLGITVTAGASDIRNAMIGASKFTAIDGSLGTPITRVSVGAVGAWSQAYNYTDLNNDKQFGNGNGATEPLTTPYMDPVFNRTVDSTSLNVTASAGLSSSPGLDAGISNGISDTNEWYVIDTYDYLTPLLSPLQAVGEWLRGK